MIVAMIITTWIFKEKHGRESALENEDGATENERFTKEWHGRGNMLI